MGDKAPFQTGIAFFPFNTQIIFFYFMGTVLKLNSLCILHFYS